MTNYLVRRILHGMLVLLIITMIVFVLVHLAGDPVLSMLPEDAPEEDIIRLRRALGLDRPVHVRYVIFLQGVLRGEFGRSFFYRRQAFPLIIERLPLTLQLSVLSLVVSTCIAVPAGIISAIKRNSWIDLAASSAAVLGRSMPNFWLGIMLILLFALQWRILPASGSATPRHFILPVITLGTAMAATVARLTRSSLLDVIGEDYIRTARAKGLSERVVLYRHALRNALIPVVTVIGLQIPGLLSGSVITETVFALPGVGRLAVRALTNYDMSVVQGTVLFASFFIVVANLIVDIMYTVLDPRIRYQ